MRFAVTGVFVFMVLVNAVLFWNPATRVVHVTNTVFSVIYVTNYSAPFGQPFMLTNGYWYVPNAARLTNLNVLGSQ